MSTKPLLLFSFLFLLLSGCQEGTDQEPTTDNSVEPSAVYEDQTPLDSGYASLVVDSVAADTAVDSTQAAYAYGPGRCRGSFVELQQGEYLHFVMKDEEGELKSYWVLEALSDEELMPFLEQRIAEGAALEITWEEHEQYLPASGQTETVQEVTGIEILN